MNSHKQLTRKILSRGSAAGVAAFFLMAGVALAQAPQSPPAPAGGMDHGAMGHDMKGMDMKGRLSRDDAKDRQGLHGDGRGRPGSLHA